MGKAARTQSHRYPGGAQAERFDAGGGPQTESDGRLQGLESGRSVIGMDADESCFPLARVYANSTDPPFRRIRHVNRSLRKTRPLHEATNLHKQSNMTRIAALLVVIGGTLAAGPGAAQFGSTFG